MLIEAVCGCVQDPGLLVVGVTEDQCTDWTPVPGNRLDEGLRPLRGRQVARVIDVGQVARHDIPSVRHEPRYNACSDAVGVSGSGDQCERHAATIVCVERRSETAWD